MHAHEQGNFQKSESKQVFVKKEQGVIEPVFGGWKGQPNFNCFDRCAGAEDRKAKQVFVKQEQGVIEPVFGGWKGQQNFNCFY